MNGSPARELPTMSSAGHSPLSRVALSERVSLSSQDQRKDKVVPREISSLSVCLEHIDKDEIFFLKKFYETQSTLHQNH